MGATTALALLAGRSDRSLDQAANRIPARVRHQFPMLEQVYVRSPVYVDEVQLVKGRDLHALLAELQRLRRICAREEFMRRVTVSLTEGSDRCETTSP
ncbi:hypothetical protein AKJ09_06940 [Labilithrix luteola]|uniref:Uncharacterized protein n=1 Tax=Labilithrix luteola TaxID=1391654 RepID=A0A0K1Q3R6_9BACT|nr:hypothetical protein [Labilithrix luteola]AKV00277.1 hypothetical protein AKJ09_06940 [Labilithrix luteola]